MKIKKTRSHSLTFYYSLTVFFILIATMTILFSILALFQRMNWINPSKGVNLLLLFAMLAAASIVIGTICSYLFSRILLSPFRTIIESMEKVTRGDFSVQLSFDAPEELKKFSEQFNIMVKELANTEILRSDFINSFSHEFKTPIISIKGFTALLQNPDLSEAQRQEYMGIILEESERLTELSTNILNLTKLENTEILTGLEPCDPAEQIRRCLILLQSRWEKKQLIFQLDLIDLTMMAKADLLQQVWLNLLDNAIKFSQPGGTIHILMIQTDQSVSLIFKDEGIGMSEDQLQRIFRKFYQTDQGREKGGNGLGLNVVKRIVELHHGSIATESQPHQGTSFTIQLPKA